MKGPVSQEWIDRFWEPEYFDIIIPLIIGSAKYEDKNYQGPEGKTMSHKDNYSSIGRHLSAAALGLKLDHDAPCDPRLSAANRLMMDYWRDMNGVKHPDDPPADDIIEEANRLLEKRHGA